MFFEGEVLKLMGLVFLAKPVGLIVQVLLARYFGAGEQYDAYALALFLVSYAGAVAGIVYTNVVLPFTIQLRKELDRDRLSAFQNATILLFLVPAVVYMLILMFQGELVIRLVGPELPDRTRGFAEDMIRFMAVPGLLLLLVAMLKSILNLNHCYRLPSMLPVCNAFIMLIMILALHEEFGIWSVPLGFAVSSLVQVILLARQAWVRGGMSWALPALPPGVLSKLWQLSWMILVTQSIVILYHFIDKMFASRLEVGSISSITYSYTLTGFTVQIFSASLVVVMFTRMSELVSEGRIDALNRYIRENLEHVVRIVVPISLTMVCASTEVVRVLFQRGKFTEEDTVRTASVLALYLLGLPAIVSNQVVGQVFFSMQRMGLKIVLAIQYLTTNVIGNLLLIESMGVQGLAISTAVTINLHYFLSAAALERYRVGIQGWRCAWILLRHYLIAGIVYAVYILLDFDTTASSWADPMEFWGAIVVAGVKSAFVIGCYLGVYLLPRFARFHQLQFWK